MLKNRRHRVVLMGEELIQGAGGRMTKIFPVIGNVWAAFEDSSSQMKTSAGRQYLGETVSFEIPFSENYMAVQRVRFGEQNYSVVSIRRTIDLHPSISINAIAQND